METAAGKQAEVVGTSGGVADVLGDGLDRPTSAIAYAISRRLRELFPDRALVEGDGCPFGVYRFAEEGGCELTPRPDLHSQIRMGFEGPGRGLSHSTANAAFTARWNGHEIGVFVVEWPEGFGSVDRCFLLADSVELAESFYEAVCEWTAEVRGEVLVFDGGQWHKSQELYRAIQGAGFDNLVLEGDLKQQVRGDVERFFASRATYERYNIPWKRGLLFLGPPGNGKTHTIKAVLNASAGVPCLYVKSFKADHRTDHDNIRSVFRRARLTTPCILVLEDLDSLIDEENRAFFLNELDGFAANVGILTLATTNHPERLDPSIVDRPSRFDRKYHFALPGAAEREAYVRMWNGTLQPELRLSEAGVTAVVERTEEFSYAYLKELFVSSTMRWIDSAASGGGAMDALMAEQADALREQMSSMTEAAEPSPEAGEGAAEMAAMARRFLMRRYRR